MKRTKFIALTLIVSIMLMGAGYAYWSDTLTINNTVATGELSVVFENAFGLNKQVEDYDNDPPSNPFQTGDFDYVNINMPGRMPQVQLVADTNGEAGDKITYYSENFYPGAGSWLKFTVKNNGTIPAKLEGITGVVDTESDSEILNQFVYSVGNVRIVKNGVESWQNWGVKKCDNFDQFIEVMSERLSKTKGGETIVLEPGDWIEVNQSDVQAEGIGYDIFMRTDAPDTTTENKTLKFDLNLVYTQFNEN